MRAARRSGSPSRPPPPRSPRPVRRPPSRRDVLPHGPASLPGVRACVRRPATLGRVADDLITVPPTLAANLAKYYEERGRAWVADAPRLAAEYLDRWELRPDGAAKHGVVALVLPVRRADGTPAMLKLQIVDPEHLGEGDALRTWNGDAAVRLIDVSADGGVLLLEKLDHTRDLLSVADDVEAAQITAALLVRLHAYTAPPEIRPLSDVVEKMLAFVPEAAPRLADPTEATLLRDWAAAVGEVAGECGDRLLHWDLHFENVLAGGREEWLAIDPKPLAGDPGFDLLPALHNRWDEVMAAPDPARAVLRRFDAMVEVMGLDRDRAAVWTVARTLQNSLWTIEDGEDCLETRQVLVAQAVTRR
ncbi:MAG: hydroxyurea phosphotransferase [Hamadaea sp.]|nr:hydroxyurea phosphotransferase [Hamadaea sp.]